MESLYAKLFDCNSAVRVYSDEDQTHLVAYFPEEHPDCPTEGQRNVVVNDRLFKLIWLEPARHEGCECAYCEEEIEDEDDGVSSPQGSMHTDCAEQHEQENPEEW